MGSEMCIRDRPNANNFFLMIRRPPRSTQSRSSAASDVYKRQRLENWLEEDEDINQNLDFKQKSSYNNERKYRSFSDKREDDPWI